MPCQGFEERKEKSVRTGGSVKINLPSCSDQNQLRPNEQKWLAQQYKQKPFFYKPKMIEKTRMHPKAVSSLNYI